MTKPQIAIITHAMGPPVRGNGTTTSRWMGVLQERGYGIEAVAPGSEPKHTPDIVHGYHAAHGGAWARDLAERVGCPLVVSIGGTDLYSLSEERSDAALIRDVVHASAMVTGAFASFGARLCAEMKIDVPYAAVRRGVYLEATRPPKACDESLRVLLVAGLRPVKDPMFAVDLAERLRDQGVSLTLRILGPTLNAAYADRLRARVRDLEHVSLGLLPSVSMGSAYRNADVVWNTSLHEGGSNAALEALAHGCALAMRDVPGNRELLSTPGAPGLLFQDRDTAAVLAFHQQIASEDDAQRAARWERALAWLRAHHDPDDEGDDLEAAYARVL